jgi:TonB C terminal
VETRKQRIYFLSISSKVKVHYYVDNTRGLIEGVKQQMRLFTRRSRLFALGASILALSASIFSTSLPVCADVLKGGVKTEDYLHPTQGPSLNRNDIGGQDAFDSNENKQAPPQQLLQPSNGSFDVKSQRPPAPPPPDFNLRAEDAGQTPDFNGTPMQGMPSAETPQTAMGPTAGPVPGGDDGMSQNGHASNDPDKTREMQLAWDAWHHRVAEAVYQRFITMSHTAFKYSGPLAAYVSYTVTRDGRVLNTTLQRKSSNVAFNAMIMLVVNSMSGQHDLLSFPPGSRRMTVEKGGMFTENYGPQQGFKFTTGDQETIHNH